MNFQLPSVVSPLMEEARMSQAIRKRATKRIKKITSNLAKNGSALLSAVVGSPIRGESSTNIRKRRSTADSDQTNILGLLENRNIPAFLLDLIKKKRIFNVGLINKMVIAPMTSSPQDPVFSCIGDYCNRQEAELVQIVKQNKERMEARRGNRNKANRNVAGSAARFERLGDASSSTFSPTQGEEEEERGLRMTSSEDEEVSGLEIDRLDSFTEMHMSCHNPIMMGDDHCNKFGLDLEEPREMSNKDWTTFLD